MVTVSKFKKSKNDGSSVTINNNSRGYSNTNNYSNVNTSGLDRMLWNIHDTGQDIDDPLTLPSLTVNGHIQAGTIDASGYINSLTGMTAPYGNFSDLWSNTGHIGYVYSDYIQTTDLKVTHTADIENIISRNISTENLTVTKSAHFAELIIDKIKSVGGAAIFSPADGFKIESEDDIIRIYDASGNETNYWMLCWDADDDRGRTINMWTEGDQAICQNFNEANEGKNYDISNTYFWMLVFGAGTYDPDPESSQHADIQYHAASSALYYEQGHTKPYAYNADKSKITFDTVKHYIIVYNYGSTFKDALGHEAPVRDGLFEQKAGNEIVMMGHRPWAGEFTHKAGEAPSDPIPIDEEHFTEKERQSAIYISAYHSNIDTDLVAPLIAQYEGINDFTISDKRTTWFAAGNNATNGYANQITGNLRSYSGKSIDDMTEATIYYIMTDKSYISTDNTWAVASGSKMNISCMYIQGNNTGYAGAKDSNIRLSVCYRYNSQANYDMYAGTYISGPLQIDLDKYYSGHLDTLTLQIERENGNGYDILAVLSVPVIPEAGGQPGADGDDGEMYKLIKLNELAQIDVAGNFGIYLRYRVDHIIGATSTPVTEDETYKIRFKTDKAGESYKILDFSNGIYTYDKDGGQDGYYEINVFGTTPGSHNLLSYKYLTIELYNSTTGTVMDTSVIPITLLAGAMFSITDEITSRVTANGTTAYTAYNLASEAKQTAEGFDQRVTKTETDINSQQDTITGLQTDISRIQQTADSITSEITKISGVGGENLLVNSCFQVSEENDLPEKWNYYNENTIVKCESEGSLNYVNINNNKGQPNTDDGKYRGIQQTTQDRFDTVIQDFYPNHIYCFSFYGKKNSTYGEISCFIHYLDNTGTHFEEQVQYQDQTYCDFDLTSDWQRYTFIFKTPNNNIIYSFNIILEYYGNIKRGTETSIPVRDNDVDIMMPMLLDFGTATNERMDMYGLYSLSGEDHVYDKWINTDYNVNSVPRWQGNSQDVSVSSSQIEQTAELIRAQVGDCGINITDKKITLNGNTEINGSLNIYNSYTGFILNGSEGMTQITADSVGDYDSFKARSNTTINKIESAAGTYVTSTGRYITNNYAFRIYLGKYKNNKTITFNSLDYKFYTNTNSDIRGNMVHSKTVNIEETYNGSTISTAKNFDTFTYTVQNTDADIYLFVELSIGHPISAYGPISQIGYCDLTINYTIPNDAFTLIGYDGIGMNFGTSANVYFNKDNTILRYGSSGLRVSVGGVTKWNGSEWVNLNTPSIKKLGTDEDTFSWTNSLYDMVVTTSNTSKKNVKISLPVDPYIGRTVYIRKRGRDNIEVRANKDIMTAWDRTSSSDIIDTNEYLTISNGREYKFTFDGEYWLANRMDNA